MTQVAEMLDSLRASLDHVSEQLEAVAKSQMELPVPRRQQPANVRNMFHRLIAHHIEHTVHLEETLTGIGVGQSEAQILLRKLYAAQGELEGLLVGLPEGALGKIPKKGEWSARQVLEHVIETHRMYTQRIKEALEEPEAGATT